MLPLLADAFVGPHVHISGARVSLRATQEEHVSMTYCTGCRWMMRAAWMAQELLTTFQEELDSITLIPSRPPAPGGVFVRF
jgi:predicted Rdx family selenoprotein